MKNVYTADHEEPDCMRCDHVCDPCEFCGENCGAEHGWNGYKRTVVTTPVKNRDIFNEEEFSKPFDMWF